MSTNPNDDQGLTVEWKSKGSSGMGTARVLNGKVVICDRFNIQSANARSRFVTQVREKCPAIDDDQAAKVEEELLRFTAAPAAASTPNPATLPEVDVSSIIRPERFIHAEVTGLAVPSTTIVDDEPVGQLLLYLAWANGKREARPIPLFVETHEERKLWIHPLPAEPAAGMVSAWSKEARDEWLKGEVVYAADVYQAVRKQITWYIDFPIEHAEGNVTILALWTVLTYIYPAWSAVPYLYIGGPIGSGKTRVFDVLRQMVFRPYVTSSTTGPTIFRTLHSQGGTLLLDEAERLRQSQDPTQAEVLSMLLAGYRRGGQATRMEPVGDTFKVVSFDVYSPKALACIAGLPPALASRCIPIMMFRAGARAPQPKRRIDPDDFRWQGLRDNLHALAMQHGPTWLALRDDLDACGTITNRDLELWQPLLALATWFESQSVTGLVKVVQDHAAFTINSRRDEAIPEEDEMLLTELAAAVCDNKRVTPSMILSMAMKKDESLFKSWTAQRVSSRLRNYGIPTPKKSNGRRVYRVNRDVLRKIQDNYGIELEIPVPIPTPRSRP